MFYETCLSGEACPCARPRRGNLKEGTVTAFGGAGIADRWIRRPLAVAYRGRNRRPDNLPELRSASSGSPSEVRLSRRGVPFGPGSQKDGQPAQDSGCPPMEVKSNFIVNWSEIFGAIATVIKCGTVGLTQMLLTSTPLTRVTDSLDKANLSVRRGRKATGLAVRDGRVAES
jgi:hypothetical protein